MELDSKNSPGGGVFWYTIYMTFRKIEKGYLIRLFKGELLIATLKDFFKKEKITSGFLQGIGGATQAEIGIYDLDKKEYRFKEFAQTLEIVSLTGNLTNVEGRPHLHLHVVIADQDQRTFGGHLKEATIGGTCEIYFTQLADEVSRSTDSETGLQLWDL